MSLKENKLKADMVAENRIMMMDLSGMDPLTREFCEMRRIETMQELGGAMADDGGDDSSTGGDSAMAGDVDAITDGVEDGIGDDLGDNYVA